MMLSRHLARLGTPAPLTHDGLPQRMLLLLLLLQYLVDKLSSVLDSRANSSPDVAAAGMVVNTMGYVDGLGYELLLHAIKSLKVVSSRCVHATLHLHACFVVG
jgi:hypothetical protein